MNDLRNEAERMVSGLPKAKKKYTEKIHAARLIQLLETAGKYLCQRCPADLGFAQGTPRGNWDWRELSSYPCTVCCSFVGKVEFARSHCPCDFLLDPVKESWIALEEKGYI